MQELPRVVTKRARVRGVANALIACAGALASCAPQMEGSAHAAGTQPAPKVSVAQPLVVPFTEFSEHTGRAQAAESVEIRTRAVGHLMQSPFREGSLVKRGDLLFVVDPRPFRTALARARAELQSVRIERELAGKDLQRADQLFRTGAIPQRDLDSQSAQVALYDARAEVVSATMAGAELDLDYAHVRSPIDGRVGRKLVTVGNLVGPETGALTTIVSVDPMHVYIDVEETRALGLMQAEGPAAQIGFAGEDGYPHEGHVDFVDNRVDPATGTRKVRLVVLNPRGDLSDGMFARVRLARGAQERALLISEQALLTDQDRRFVWVIDDTGKAQYRAIKPGPLEHDLRVVRDGLSASDRVVVQGLQRVRPGALVTAELVSMRGAEVRGAP